MTKGSQGDKPSPKDRNAAKNASSEKSQVAKTKLDINMDDLIDPLHPQNLGSDSSVDPQLGDSKVAKTMLEMDVESLSAEEFRALRKELAKTLPESATLKNRSQVEQSIQEEAAIARQKKLETENAKQEKKSVEISAEKANLAKLAKTIPESATRKKTNETETSSERDDDQDFSSLKKLATTIPESETSKHSQGQEGEDESVSLKELAKTIPDPPMQERIAVAKRIERIRTYQKTVQVKSIKFSKTMTQANIENLHKSVENVQESSQWKSPPQPSNAKKPIVREQFVARTKLDHDILFQAVSSSKLKEEARVAAFLVEKSKEAPKPPPVAVKADKQSSACPFKWEETDSKEKYRYCTKCQTPVYNFDGMERPEAEALIFNRENLDKFTLYSRADGKFTTVDCPLQKKRQRDFIMGLIVAVALLIGAIGLFLLTPPPPPPATVETAPGSSNGGATDSTSPNNSGDSSVSSDNSLDNSSESRTFSSTAKERPSARKKVSSGSGADGGAAGLQTFKLPSATQRGAQAPDPDEDGSFWKF